MLDKIRQISNPFLRAIYSGFVLSTLITIPVTGAIFLINPKNESAHKLVVNTSLASALVGAGLGLFSGRKGSKSSESKAGRISAGGTEWEDWRKFIVFRKVNESSNIVSFYLKPSDQGYIPNFIPGQFLTIKLDIPNQSKPIIRTYSLSDYMATPSHYRLSIKRELSPPALSVPAGVASNFMHDHIQEGSEILAKPASGKFVLEATHSRPAVLVSNGVGITPMIAIAKAVSLLNPSRHIWFLHGARDGSLHAFRDEVNKLAASNPNLHVLYCYSQPKAEDAGHYHAQGYVDIALIRDVLAPKIRNLCGSLDVQYFLCGSSSFMDSLRGGLMEWGVPATEILFESFSKPIKSPTESLTAQPSVGMADASEIVFSKSGKTLYWDPNDGSILDFAEENDIYPDYSCRAGVCGTCMCKIIEGEVTYDEPPTADVDRGSVLICISRPKTAKVVLDI
jgi:uncharacterized protein